MEASYKKHSSHIKVGKDAEEEVEEVEEDALSNFFSFFNWAADFKAVQCVIM